MFIFLKGCVSYNTSSVRSHENTCFIVISYQGVREALLNPWWYWTEVSNSLFLL